MKQLAVLRSVGATMIANLTNQLIVVLTQLVVLPVLLAAWGTEGLGTWLILTAVPTYLSISDLGFITAAKSDASIRVAKGDWGGASTTISSVAALLVIAFTIIAAVFSIVVLAIDWSALFNFSGFSTAQSRTVLFLGLIQIGSYQAFLLGAAVIRASGHPALEVYLNAGFRAAETTMMLIVGVTTNSLEYAAVAWSATRLTTTLALWLCIWAGLPRLLPKWSLVSRKSLMELLGPSLGFMLMPLSNAFFIQGTALVLGAVGGPAIVAAWTVMRTVTRLGVSAANVLNYAFVPQYSYSIGSNNIVHLYHLVRGHIILLLLGVVAYVGVVLTLGPWFVAIMSHGAFEAHYPAFIFLICAAALEMIWGLPVAVATGINRIGRVSLLLFGLSALSLLSAAILTPVLAIDGASVTVAAAHLIMLFACMIWLVPTLRAAMSKAAADGQGERSSP